MSTQTTTPTKPAEQKGPSPEHFFMTVNAYQRSAAIKGAIELDLFTAIADGKKIAADIAAACRASERGVRILCDYLVVAGFLTKSGNAYQCTQDTAIFLNKKSPAYIGGTIEFMLSPHITENFKDVAAIVRRGGSVSSGEAMVEPDNPAWVTFAKAMMPMMAKPAEAIAAAVLAGSTSKMRVLDVAGGHGLFGLAFAKANPNAEVTLQDWKAVAEVGKENAKRAGVADRFKVLPGDAFTVDFGGGYDVVLLTNFLHHFDPPTCEKLLKKVHAALVPGGRAVTLEFVPNEDRVSPPVPATFSMMMLGGTPGGDAYTLPELQRMMSNAGFRRNEAQPVPASPQQMVVSYK